MHFQEWQSGHHTSEERPPGNKGRCIPRTHIRISLGWNGMAGDSCWPVPSPCSRE